MNFSASNTGLWNGMIQLGILSAILLAANVLRRKVGFIRKSNAHISISRIYYPSSTGFCVISLKAIFPGLHYLSYYCNRLYSIISAIPESINADTTSLDGLKSGALIVSTYLMQGILGVIISAGLALQ